MHGVKLQEVLSGLERERLKHWRYTCTFVAFLNYNLLLSFIFMFFLSTWGVKSQKCVQIKTCYVCMSSSFVGRSGSPGSGGVERGKGYKQTAALAMWWNHA